MTIGPLWAFAQRKSTRTWILDLSLPPELCVVGCFGRCGSIGVERPFLSQTTNVQKRVVGTSKLSFNVEQSILGQEGLEPPTPRFEAVRSNPTELQAQLIRLQALLNLRFSGFVCSSKPGWFLTKLKYALNSLQPTILR